MSNLEKVQAQFPAVREMTEEEIATKILPAKQEFLATNADAVAVVNGNTGYVGTVGQVLELLRGGGRQYSSYSIVNL